MLCDDLEGWDREDGREAQEGGDTRTCVCIWLVRFVVQQKLTQYCEAVILQYRAKPKKKASEKVKVLSVSGKTKCLLLTGKEIKMILNSSNVSWGLKDGVTYETVSSI